MRKIGYGFFLPYILSNCIFISCRFSDRPTPAAHASFSTSVAELRELPKRSIASNMAEIEELYDDLFRQGRSLHLKTVPGEITDKIDRIVLCFDDCRKSIPSGLPGQSGTTIDSGLPHEIQAYTDTIREIMKLFNLLREAAVSRDQENYKKFLYEIDEIKRKSHSRFG